MAVDLSPRHLGYDTDEFDQTQRFVADLATRTAADGGSSPDIDVPRRSTSARNPGLVVGAPGPPYRLRHPKIVAGLTSARARTATCQRRKVGEGLHPAAGVRDLHPSGRER